MGAHVVKALLAKASSLCTMAVVTLAQPEWVSTGVRDFMPELSEVVKKLDFVFASEESHERNIASTADLDVLAVLKRKAMDEAIEQFTSRLAVPGTPIAKWESLISIGDGEAEERAAKEVGRQYTVGGRFTFTKTVRLRGHPSLEQLTTQAKQLADLLDSIVDLK